MKWIKITFQTSCKKKERHIGVEFCLLHFSLKTYLYDVKKIFLKNELDPFFHGIKESGILIL